MCMTVTQFTHKDLVTIATRWAERRHSVAIPEPNFCFTQEIPDVIGFNSHFSTVIEVKTSRSDFFNDRKKPFRREHWAEHKAMGNYRIYCVPVGLVDKSEIPDGWGMLLVDAQGKARLAQNVYLPKHRKTYWHDIGSGGAQAERSILFTIAYRAQYKGLMKEICRPIYQDAM